MIPSPQLLFGSLQLVEKRAVVALQPMAESTAPEATGGARKEGGEGGKCKLRRIFNGSKQFFYIECSKYNPVGT